MREMLYIERRASQVYLNLLGRDIEQRERVNYTKLRYLGFICSVYTYKKKMMNVIKVIYI